jgi:nucleoside-diphosphate-sugar epimerase
MQILVTGGGGFLGRYLVEQLLAHPGGPHSVRIFARGSYPELLQLNEREDVRQSGARVELARGDITDAAVVAEACRGCEAVFHAAAVPGVWGPWEKYHSINTVGTEHLLEGCRRHGVKRLIYTSSPSVIYDGRPHENANESLPYPPGDSYLCHYPHSKALAEQAVLAANGPSLATVALRPHLIWGPRDNHLIPRLIQRAKSGRLIRVGDGTNKISMSYVENAAAAHLQAFDALQPGAACAGKAYFINEVEPVVLWKWVDELLALAGLPPVRKAISKRTAWMIGRALETVYGLLRIRSEPPMTRFLAAQLAESHWYDVSAAQRDFGYRPIVSVEEGMKRIAGELRQLATRS